MKPCACGPVRICLLCYSKLDGGAKRAARKKAGLRR